MERGWGGQFIIRCSERQKRWPDVHENEWKSATDDGQGSRGHLQDETETWDKGGAQESMWVTLAVTHYIWDMEPEEATSCCHARSPME